MFQIYRSLLCQTLLTLAILAPTASAVALPSACDAPQTLLSSDSRRHAGGALDETHCYRLETVEPGLLHLDLSVAAASPSRVRFVVLAADGAPAVLRTLERSASERLLLVPAGTWFLEVATEDPRLPLPAYRLGSRFVESQWDHSETDGELEPDPDMVTSGATAHKSETDGELEPDPDMIRQACPTSARKSETDGELEPDPDMIRVGCVSALRELLCVDGDDHGDTFACSTVLHGRTSGELDNGWGDDADVFRFELDRWQTVEITTEGDIDTHGVLYDATGQRLDSDDDGGEGRNFRLVRTLGPGIWFVRVEGLDATGVYSLAVHDTGR